MTRCFSSILLYGLVVALLAPFAFGYLLDKPFPPAGLVLLVSNALALAWLFSQRDSQT